MPDAPTPPYLSEQEVKEQIVEFGRLAAEKDFVIATEGNLSALVGPDALWITPADLNKGKLSTSVLVKMKLDGTVLSDGGHPSSEAKMHLRVYLENPAARGVVHCHPLYATSFGIAGIALDAPILAEPMMALGPVPVAHYAKPGTYDVPDSIAPFCNDYNAVLLSNHGALTWGHDLQEAYYRMEIMESYAKFMFINRFLGRVRPLSNDQLAELYELKVEKGLGTVKMPASCNEPQNLTDVLPNM